MKRSAAVFLLVLVHASIGCREVQEPLTDTADKLPWETDTADIDDRADIADIHFGTDSTLLPVPLDTNPLDTFVPDTPVADTGDDTDTGTAIPASPDSEWNPVWDEIFAEETLARDIRISAIDFYQNTRIRIMEDGQQGTNPWIALVENKDALLRVSVTPAPHRAPGQIMARIAIRVGEEQPEIIPLLQEVSGPSDDAALDTTFNLQIPAAYVVGSLRIRVSLHEPDPGNITNGSTADTIWPPDGMFQIPVETTGGGLRLVVVPIRYDADLSGRLPDTSNTELSRIADITLAMMPFPDVEMHIAAAIAWSEPLKRSGDGWSELLTALMRHRGETGSYRDYYIGLINPADTFKAYCRSTCVTGMSPVSHRDYVAGRAFLALGYGGDDSVFTILHEMGHAMGRKHTPTAGDPADPDPDYPYSNGIIGSPGWHAGLQQYYAPDEYYDIMGYQWPQWISDYTAGALKERLAYVNSHAWARILRTGSFSSAILYADGRVTQAGSFVGGGASAGRPVQVTWLNDRSEPVDTRVGYYTSYSGGFSGLVVFETPPDTVVAIQLEGAAHPLNLQ